MLHTFFHRYAKMFPEMCRAIEYRCMMNKAQAEARVTCKGTIDGQTLVGFGPHSKMSRQALFRSTKEEHKAYVQSIIEHPVTHPGGQLDKLKQYFMKEQGKERADDLALVQCMQDLEQRNKIDGMA